MTTSSNKLTLYHFDSCPYCAKTRNTIKALGLNIELKDIKKNHQNRTDLHLEGKKIQVPCLRIEEPSGNTTWLYESDDIIDFLASKKH